MPSQSGALPGMWNANYLPGAAPAGIPNLPSHGRLDISWAAQPLPITVEDQIRLSPKTRYSTFTRHTFEQARLPDPGNPAWAFTSLGLAEFSPIGPGHLPTGELRKLQGAPLFAAQTISTAGLGGVVMGQIQRQALMLSPGQASGLSF